MPLLWSTEQKWADDFKQVGNGESESLSKVLMGRMGTCIGHPCHLAST